MKKRVVKNEKAKKQAAQGIPPPLSSYYPYTLPPFASTSAPPPQSGYLSYITDTTEMRQCAAQSARDKRKACHHPAVV
jgi:hypothetical protein